MRRFFRFGAQADAVASVPWAVQTDNEVETVVRNELDAESEPRTIPNDASASSEHQSRVATTCQAPEVLARTPTATEEDGFEEADDEFPQISSSQLMLHDPSAPHQLLCAQIEVLRAYTRDAVVEETVSAAHLVASLKGIAETMVWADQNDPILWDVFLEFATMPLIVRCLHATQKMGGADGNLSEESEKLRTALSEEASGQGEARRPLGGSISRFDRNTVDANSTKPPNDSQKQAAKFHADIVQGFESSAAASFPNSQEKIAYSEAVAGTVAETESLSSNKTLFATVSENFDVSSSMSGPKLRSRTASAVSYASSLLSGQNDGNGVAESRDDVLEDEGGQTDVDVQAQILQTMSIIIQSVSRQESLLCLFSANHINDILSFNFEFENEEVLAYFMSAVKSIALKLDPGLLQLFFDPMRETFPLYTAVTAFFDHPESMVRIAVRNVTLKIYSLGDSELLRFVAKDENLYMQNNVELLAKLCGSVARAFELLLDDGREIRRTRSRTGIFRRQVKSSELTAKVEEIENICGYLGDVSVVSQAYLHSHVVTLISTRLFSPFFRPLASRASPTAIQLLDKRWRMRATSLSENKPALPLFDAAARCLLLACILSYCQSSPLGPVLVRDLCRPTHEFEQRHVLHGLKAMAADITGTERVTFVALCTIEAFIACEAASEQLLSTLHYDLYLRDSEDEFSSDHSGQTNLDLITPGEDDLEHRTVQPLLMTLSEFEVPMTPTTSRPSTPTFGQGESASSMDDFNISPNGFGPDSRFSSFDSNLNLLSQSRSAPRLERASSDGILTSFQMGDESLREAISSIILVVRRREVRTMRVVYAVVRIITALEKKTADVHSSIDVSKIMLDELAGVVKMFMESKKTTIVAIEEIFDNFRALAKSVDPLQDLSTLQELLSPDNLPAVAAEFPKGTGKRRRVQNEQSALPVEPEDAFTFFSIARVYDNSVESACALDRFGSLSQKICEALTENGVDDSYLDKRDALETLGEIVLKHGELE